MVLRNGLWSKRINSNINGKCFKLIRNMYNNLKSRISTAEGTSAYFPCNCGVRQGEIYILFLCILMTLNMTSILILHQEFNSKLTMKIYSYI